jgi:hypothetical protein
MIWDNKVRCLGQESRILSGIVYELFMPLVMLWFPELLEKDMRLSEHDVKETLAKVMKYSDYFYELIQIGDNTSEHLIYLCFDFGDEKQELCAKKLSIEFELLNN